MNFNLPPGIKEAMIPGNRPGDIAFDEWYDREMDNLVQKFIEQEEDFLKEWLKELILDDPEYVFKWTDKNNRRHQQDKFWRFVEDEWSSISAEETWGPDPDIQRDYELEKEMLKDEN